MKREISERLLRSPEAAPREKPFEIYDTRLPGFALRVQPSGWRSFFIRWHRNKRKTIGAVGRYTARTARLRAEAMLGNIYQGHDPEYGLECPRQDITLRKFLDEHYRSFAQGHFSDASATLKRLETCFSGWLDLEIGDLTTAMIQRWVNDRRNSGISSATVNRDLAALGAALNRAVRWGLLKSNPSSDVDRCPVDRAPKTRHLSGQEKEQLLAALRQRDRKARLRRVRANEWRRERGRSLLPTIGEYSDHVAPMVLLSLNTGCRRGELLSLKWEDICFQTRTMTVTGANTKNGQTRTIPLNEAAVETLREWRKASTGSLVFTNRKGEQLRYLKTAWRNLLRKADISGFRWHDLRHTFASDLALAGIDLNTIRELMGHSDIAMTLRYAHLTAEHKQAAVEKLCA